MTRLRFLLLESVHDVARVQLEAAGFEVRMVPGSMKEDELIKALADVDVLGIRSKTMVTPRVIEGAKHLRAIGAFCIGTNQVALEEAMKRGIVVFNAPFSNTRSVAELVMAEIVMLSRHLGDRVREMHQGVWKKVAKGAHEVRGKTLGIVGYGHIGRQIGVIAEALGLRVLFYDVATVLPMGNNQACKTLEEVLGQSDFVTLHVPATPQTHGMMGEKELAAMKPGACLINASRGTVVDLAALAAALKSGHVGGAAVDVYPDEPEENVANGFVTDIQGLPNVILTPHIGGSTLEAQEAIGREVATSLTKFVKFGSTIGSVNFPNVEMPRSTGSHRVMNVHKNVPGVLRDINKIVSDLNGNVSSQVLATNADVGYLLMDFDQPIGTSVCDAMNKLDTTIRAANLSG